VDGPFWLGYSAFFGVEKEAANFGFSGKGHDIAEDLGNVENGSS
jgi:hypothetical protein